MPVNPYPDLPLDICGEILNAVLRELAAITLLEPVVGDRIRECESIDTALAGQTLTIDAPAFLVAMGPQLEVVVANAGYSVLTTSVDICLLSKCTDPLDTQDQLRPRVFHQVKLRLMREGGTLRSGDGEVPENGDPDNRITNAVQGFGQINPTGQLVRQTNLFATTFRVAWKSDIDASTRAFIG